MKGLIEKRAVPFEVRAGEDGKPRLRGLAVVFNVEAVIGGYFREVIRPGAFTKTIAERDIKCLWNHDSNFVLGSTRAGTLLLQESIRGLEVDDDPPTLGANAGFLESIERGDVTNMSFMFEVIKENVTRFDNEMDLREILEVKLWEVSPVTFPAYKDTEIGLRAAEVRAGWVQQGILPESLVRSGDEGAEGDTTPEPDPGAVHSVEPGEEAREAELFEVLLSQADLDDEIEVEIITWT